MGIRTKTFTAAAGLATVVSLTAFTAALGAPAAVASSSGRSVLAGSAAPSSARAHPAGAVTGTTPVNFELVLALRDPAGAQALVQAVSTPGSASYRHYLTAAQWEASYSPTAADITQAKDWLASQGFTVGAVSKDGITIAASGTAAQVERAFGTGLENYRVGGQTERLATGNLSVPSSLAGTVVGALGVNQYLATPAIASTGQVSAAATSAPSQFPPPPPAFLPAPPCGAYYNQDFATVTPAFGQGYPTKVPYEVCGYKPGQLRSAYDLSSKNTGSGVTVAIVDAYGSATIASDATHYFQLNDPSLPFATAHFSQIDAFPFDDETECAADTWSVEQAIDVESVHSMAPDAHILYVGAQDCINGLFNADQTVIDNGLANVVTNSWGDVGGDLLDDIAYRTAFDDVFMLADSTGMSILYSTGDDGDNFNLLGASAPDYPASSPFVTAVGGTSVKIGSTGVRYQELGWATGRSFKCTSNVVNLLPGCTKATVNTWLPVTYDGGSGGGTSYSYTQPWYQAPVVPAVLALRNEPILGPVKTRVIPDISMDADPSTGFLIGLTEVFPNGKVGYNEPRYGGTSLASPLLAATIADADQASLQAGGSYVGFVNPAIYRLSGNDDAINDITAHGLQAQLRVDHAFTYVPGATGYLESFRELTYEGPITYCDETGNCAVRFNTLSTARGYDSMTGLGAPGMNFIGDLSKF